jgi:hypothetical protein
LATSTTIISGPITQIQFRRSIRKERSERHLLVDGPAAVSAGGLVMPEPVEPAAKISLDIELSYLAVR